MSLKVGIIGVSGFGNVHYRDLMHQVVHGRADISAATVINQDSETAKCQALRALGCELFDDYQVMLDNWRDRLDLCMIPTGIAWHAPMTIAALQSGANVMVEKPAAGTVAEVRAMQAAAQQTGKLVAVGYQNMYAPSTMTLKKMIMSGALGQIECIKAWGLWPRPDDYYTRNQWAGRLKQGEVWIYDSPFNNAFAHFLMLMCFWAGPETDCCAEPETITAELYRAHEIESTDTACMRITNRNGCPPVLFYVTHCSAQNCGPEITVRGRLATAVWTFGGITITHRDGRTEQITDIAGDALRNHMLQCILDASSGKHAFTCDLNLAITQTLCATHAHQSSPIRTIPADCITRQSAGNSIATVITGIDDIIRHACQHEQLFSEANVPWAQPAQSIIISG